MSTVTDKTVKQEDTDNLYREELMDIYKNPHNRGQLPSPTLSVYHKNPSCGDEINLELNVDSAGTITDAKFNGSACMVSVVSSSKLIDSIKGKTLAEAKQFTKEKLLETIGLNLTTSRVRCATLSWEALQEALETYDKPKRN